MKKEKEVTCIRLDKQLKKLMKDLASKECRSMSNQIAFILNEYLKLKK